ncbi:uncharacterized protein BCR38DRAFT_354352 [Pseudomassariella vexata]|uniref:Secondary alcohol dehydrogenase n=1 Tax=Pseudomassariella vexata TaxID=1141098 RepID=A0A1Y2DE34_9PEZI|nr:uncharacterized protein BCR38DRAFT_354352 [Pseudomassariella vexata]ORY57509.1 hypothetical protein BCR38DRAFT_354352 [Pseudomassariella vexata]
MSSEATPINPARFAEALKELPASTLALKVLELRNSIAHLDYSNAELKPFTECREPTLGSTDSNLPDQDCIDAIAENEAVIARMQGRIELIRTEVENRGLSWAEFQGQEQQNRSEDAAATTGGGLTNGVNGHTPVENGQQHPAWQDGTFQTGTVRGLGDEELMRQLQERMNELNSDHEQDSEGGLHL